MSAAEIPTGPISSAVLSDIGRVEAVPWHIWTCITATVCITLGVYWDISWHITIGRDTFWTPAHLLIQFGAILAASSSAYLIFRTTFAGNVLNLLYHGTANPGPWNADERPGDNKWTAGIFARDPDTGEA